MMDRRIKKTKQALNQALFTLLDEKTFQQITITDIVTVADVNRGTFYKHYRDKEELLDSILLMKCWLIYKKRIKTLIHIRRLFPFKHLHLP